MSFRIPSKLRWLPPAIGGAAVGIGLSLVVSTIIQRRHQHPPARPALTGEELAQAEAAEKLRHAQAFAAFRAERADPGFSGPAKSALVAAFEKMAGPGSFKTIDVDCRATSCMATFEWATYQLATDLYRYPMHEVLPVNCAREIRLDPPADSAKPYQGSMLMTHCRIEPPEAKPARG
jgi:hypothetical protein